MRPLLFRRSIGAVVIIVGAFVAIGIAQARDPENVAEGMRIFRQKGDCQACHGWAADGRKMDTQMPDGANLRTTKLNRDLIVTVIKCGRPGRAMPAYDRLAYVDDRCNGLKRADLKSKGLEL